ncbi:c-type cytochrome [Thermoleptolyngbya sichuanensis XZ-Cy5]|uniref:c-type cytochrome n=1 Tax=Thermoleptolyngbya sichuanensis TaxID=2885951 RepID=UPI00240DE234|nr:c-type cytochrome [Thermoleptolyngbya sichuanensis]MDG2615602.1 c-type cytochrome [Thermoleptolyngbya sichuanensis XZ-Cy5]
MKVVKYLVAVVLLLVLSVAFPQAALAADLAHGQQLFSSNCAVCHLGGGNSIMSIKTLKKDALEKFLAGYGPTHNEKAIVKQITYGKGMMPAFKSRLTEDEIADIAAYVQFQSENDWNGQVN